MFPKKILFFLGLFLAITLSYFFILNDDFSSLRPIKGDLNHISSFEADKINQTLSQPFYYFSEGGQSIVFVSKDNQTILKLLKYRNFNPSKLIKILPDFLFKNFKADHIKKRQQRLQSALLGHQIAFEEHRLESGLIHVQLKPSNQFKEIEVHDKRGIKRIIDINQYAFILQKKAEVFSSVMENLLKQGKMSEAKTWIDKLFSLYLSEYQKGIYDLDHGIMHNIGCVNHDIIHLDVGSFIKDEKMKTRECHKNDLIKVTRKVYQWLNKHYPSYKDELVLKLEEKLQQHLNEPVSLKEVP